MNLLSFSQFILNFREITMNSLSFLRVHYKFIVFIANLVRTHLIFRIHYDFSLCFAYILWIHLKFSMNSLGVSLISYEFTIFPLNSLWICYIFPELTMNSLLFFANSSWFHSLSIADSTRTGDHQSGKEAETWKQISHSRIIRSSWFWV